MANKIKFSAEVMADIVAMYKQGMSLKEIQERHNIRSPSTIYVVLRDMGVEWEKAGVKITHKKCICGNTKNSLQAKYCFMCGRFLLSEEEQAVEKLLTVRAKFLRNVPDASREEADKAIMDVINIVKIKCNIK